MATSVTIRMYNQQTLGDCFLLQFQEGTKDSFVLIDFGSYTSGEAVRAREREIAESIRDTVGESPLTIVLTHQHKDHLSGFISTADIFNELHVSDLWFSYLDDPGGKEAKAMRKVTEKFWNKNEEAKKKAKNKFAGNAAVEKMLAAKEAIDLFSEGQTGGEAISNLLRWCKTGPKFFVPGTTFMLPGLPKHSIRVYVMGPPTDPALLRKLDPSADEAVHNLNAMMGMMNLDTSSALMLNALNTITGNETTELENFPFNKKFSCKYNPVETACLKAMYTNEKENWRKIDHEWLSEMGRISLHMSNLTNNSSLALAFELVEQKKVLLFAADAQIGNWRSWLDLSFKGTDTDGKDLLARTVFYKAGHHSSHNATLDEALNMMNDEELVIMIPVNEKVSKNMKFAMLQPGMLKGYNRKSNGRVLRADTVYHSPRSAKSFLHPFASKPTDFNPRIKVAIDKSGDDHLYIEYTVK